MEEIEMASEDCIGPNLAIWNLGRKRRGLAIRFPCCGATGLLQEIDDGGGHRGDTCRDRFASVGVVER